MDKTLPVHSGSHTWFDHSKGNTRWTVNEGRYTVVTLVAGILYGLALPSIVLIVEHSFVFFLYKRKWEPDQQGQAGDDRSEEGDDQPREADALLNPVPAIRISRPRNRKPKRWLHKVVNAITWIFTVFLVGGLWTVAGTYASSNHAGETALSGSSTCGAWGLKDTADNNALTADASLQGTKEAVAGQYARDCYGVRPTSGANQCLVFKEPRIKSVKLERQNCPFVNASYCPSGTPSAVRFTTDLVDARTIGINAGGAPKLNRTTICVPLNLNAGFVKKPKPDAPEGEWQHYLGPTSRADYTFRQFSNLFEVDVRAYTMSTYVHEYAKDYAQNYWHPIPELNISSGLNIKSQPHSMTVMFINSCRIFYEHSSDDLISPAQRIYRKTDLHFNADTRARPVACIDWIEFCPHVGSCTTPYDGTHDIDAAHVFTRYAMTKSNAFDSVFSRGATALDAQSRIRDGISLPLSESPNPPQWVQESWGIFNTSLSRIQHDALDIAMGAEHDSPGYEAMMPEKFRNHMCGLFTFQIPKGYHNLGVIYLVAVQIVIPILLYIPGIGISGKYGKDKQNSVWFKDRQRIVFDWLCHWIKVAFQICSAGFRRREQGAVAPGDLPVPGSSTAHSRDPSPRRDPSNYGSVTHPTASQQDPQHTEPQSPSSRRPERRASRSSTRGVTHSPRPQLSADPGQPVLASVESPEDDRQGLPSRHN